MANSTLLMSFVLLTLLTVCPSNGETIDLRGYVQNQKNARIVGAEVILLSDTTIRTKTDSEGKFSLTGQKTPVIMPEVSVPRQFISFYGSDIKVALTKPSKVSVAVYAVTGKTAYEFDTGILNTGIHNIALPTKQFGAGFYLIAVQCNGEKRIFNHVSSLLNHTDIGLYSLPSKNTKSAPVSLSISTSRIVFDTLLITARGYKSAKFPIQSYNQSNIHITLSENLKGSGLENITKSCDGMMPALISGGRSGWGSRYWDCCKPHCSWPENTKHLASNCGIDNEEIPCYKEINNGHATWLEGIKSGCEQNGEAYMCYRHVPFAVCEKVAYGFAAVPAENDACGRCFQLEFDGGFKHGDPKAAHALVKGKIMIVMASNIGHDVSGGQFDLMIPGGGLGAFREGCRKQWKVDVNDESLVGKGFGGFTSKCQEKLGWDADPNDLKLCVRSMCDNLFGNKPELKDLLKGCIWYVEWMHAVDNPTFRYKEVPCPEELLKLYYSSHHPKP